MLNEPYAIQIAERWNTKNDFSSYCGLVTMFEVYDVYLKEYPVQMVGDRDIHRELCIPSESLDDFNQHIIDGV